MKPKDLGLHGSTVRNLLMVPLNLMPKAGILYKKALSVSLFTGKMIRPMKRFTSGLLIFSHRILYEKPIWCNMLPNLSTTGPYSGRNIRTNTNSRSHPAPNPNDWFHARIVVESNRISVYVNSNAQPSLVVQPLVPVRGKQLGLWVGNGSDGDWKNLKITPAK